MCTGGFCINASRTSEDGTAGWGVALSEQGQCYEFHGPVQLLPDEFEFVGATRGSNNAGELSAILFG
eukprot:7912669-Pyramimonas_sp.AAC.1